MLIFNFCVSIANIKCSLGYKFFFWYQDKTLIHNNILFQLLPFVENHRVQDIFSFNFSSLSNKVLVIYLRMNPNNEDLTLCIPCHVLTSQSVFSFLRGSCHPPLSYLLKLKIKINHTWTTTTTKTPTKNELKRKGFANKI